MRRLHVFASSSDWFIGLSASSVIGQSNYFGFGFTALKKPLYLRFVPMSKSARQTTIFVHNRINNKIRDCNWSSARLFLIIIARLLPELYSTQSNYYYESLDMYMEDIKISPARIYYCEQLKFYLKANLFVCLFLNVILFVCFCIDRYAEKFQLTDQKSCMIFILPFLLIYARKSLFPSNKRK